MPRTAHDRGARRKLNQAETYDLPCGSSSHRDVQVSTGHQIYCCAVASPPLQLWPPGVRHPLQVAPPHGWTSAARHPATGRSGERGTLRPPDARRLAPNFIVQGGPRRRPRWQRRRRWRWRLQTRLDRGPLRNSKLQRKPGNRR